MLKTLKQLSEKLSFDLKEVVDDDFLEFPLLVPENFLSRINLNDKKDPLLLQILPSKNENKDVSGFDEDPLDEKKYSKIPGLIHKHHGRVLLLATDDCAVNCRFCFRRYMRESVIDWQNVFSYIEGDSSISEVILSGGDPLMLSPEKIKDILDRLSSIDHVEKIRIHSRLPIVMPERVNASILQAKKPIILVVHCNHPNEINNEVKKKFDDLRKQNIIIFNQSVLLKDINDDSDILIALSEKLFDAGVIPYYLHILDKVKGSGHFYVDEDRAKKIYHKMQERLSGYLVPKLVVEIQNRKKYV